MTWRRRKSRMSSTIPEKTAQGETSPVAIGQTRGGRLLRVIYVHDPQPDSVFLVTAYELSGKPPLAYRRRLRKKGK
jgi:hypothetical protein